MSENDDIIREGDRFTSLDIYGNTIIRVCKNNFGKVEDWNGFKNCITGKNPYTKIKNKQSK